MHEFRSLSMDSSVVFCRSSQVLRTLPPRFATSRIFRSQNRTINISFLKDELLYSASVSRLPRFIVCSLSQQRSTFPIASRDPHGEEYVRHQNRCAARGFDQPSTCFC